MSDKMFQPNTMETASSSISLADAFFQQTQSPDIAILQSMLPVHQSFRPSPLVRANLKALAGQHRRIELLTQRYNLSLQPIGIFPVFEEVRVYQGLNCNWAFSPLESDALYQYYGRKMPMPPESRAKIDRTLAAGIDMRAYIAHELPPGLTLNPGEPVPLEWVLPPTPPDVAQRTQTLAKAGVGWWRGVQAVLKGVTTAGLALTAGAVIVVAAPGLVLAAGLDPIIVGAVYDESLSINGQHLAVYYKICQWYWPEWEV